MIDFEKIFDDSSDDAPMPEEARQDRLKREDRELFEGKRLHAVQATMSLARAGRPDTYAQVFRGTRAAQNGGDEAIGIVFSGQRLDDFKKGGLFAEMEAEQREKDAHGDYSDPTREVEFTGAWKVRNWKDHEGKSQKAFDLVVASWSYTNAKGEKIAEGVAPSVKTATRQEEREAGIRAKAQSRAQSRTQPKTKGGNAFEL